MADLRTCFNRTRGFAGALSNRGLVTYAASCAFYAFLSLFPLAALAVSLVPCIGVDQAALLLFLDGIAPSGVAELMKGIIASVYENVFPALPLSMLALLWSAARALAELLKGMAAMTGHPLKTGYLKRRLRAVLLTAAMLLTLLLSLTVLVFGARITLLAELIYPRLTGLLLLLLRLRSLIMVLLMWLSFAFLYRSIPEQRYAFREVITGAALSAASWILFSALFSLYTDRLMDLTLYGGMAAMAMTMLWLFYCQYIILIGAGVCAWQHSKKEAVPTRTAP